MNFSNVDETSYELFNILEEKEKKAIKRAIENGFLNPLENAEHALNLQFEGPDGKKYRKFITDFDEKLPRRLSPDQVRDKEYDPEYCKQDLMPRIKKYGLQYPIHISSDGKINHGHNRLFSWQSLYPGKAIPAFVVSKVHELGTDGKYVQTSGSEEALKIYSNFVTNPQPESNSNTMDGVAVAIKKVFKADPTVFGFNPTGVWEDFTGDKWNKFMDFFCKGFFVDPAVRTKIRNKAGDEYSVIMPVVFNDWTITALNLGWDSGIKVGTKKPSRKSMIEWVDKDGTIINHISTNAKKLEEKVLVTLAEMYLDDTTFNSKKGVKLLIKVDKPSLDINQLNKQRSDFVQTRIDILNRRLKNRGWILIKEVAWVKQLNNPADTGQHYKLNLKTNLLEKK